MTSSIRRIAQTLVGIGGLALTLSLISSVSFYCGLDRSNCLSAALTASFMESTEYAFDTSAHMSAESTPVMRGLDTPTFADTTTLQLFGVLVTSVGVLVLIGLELCELHYVRKILRLRRLSIR